MTLKRTKINYRFYIVKVYTRNSIEWDSVGANLCVRPSHEMGEHIGSPQQFRPNDTKTIPDVKLIQWQLPPKPNQFY